MKTSDHYWTDPPADELVQRHRIHSSAPTHHIVRPDSPKRPGLQVSPLAAVHVRITPFLIKDMLPTMCRPIGIQRQRHLIEWCFLICENKNFQISLGAYLSCCLDFFSFCHPFLEGILIALYTKVFSLF